MSARTFIDGRVTLHAGDCRQVLASLPEASVDSVVCDPPYHLTSIVKRYGNTTIDGDGVNEKRAKARADAMARLSGGFMGKAWDGGDIAFQPETWAEVLRVLKPGGHLVAFSGTRTYHRMVCAIEDAGFEIRDQIGWAYGSGFPKSRNLGGGLGTALKPAWEPIVLARKPLVGTVAENVLEHGTGALNIAACRIDPGATVPGGGRSFGACDGVNEGWKRPSHSEYEAKPSHNLGRWPANLVHDGSPEVLAAFPDEAGAAAPVHRRGSDKFRHTYGAFAGNIDEQGSTFHGDAGSAARFFYTAKADAEDRLGSKHPTVKPLDLMQWLCRLVTPRGGVVLDPFAGTGTTGEAAWREGMRAILIEREPEYVADIERRMGLAANPTKRAAVAKTKNNLDDPNSTPLFAQFYLGTQEPT